MLLKILILITLQQHLVSIFGQEFPGHHPHHRHSRITDKAALLAFKKALVSDPNSTLDNWNEKTDVCYFTGVKCGKLHHRVVKISLNNSALLGLLSPALSNVTQLRFLDLVDNQLFGTIPSELSALRNLIELKLSSNHLHGQIPGSFSLLTNLRLIFLNDNNLNGTIPPAFFFNCTRLKNIDFSSNRLTGNIPPEIGNCPNLWNLNLYSNQLIGEIPASLGNATGMVNLDVENNSISGELPSETFSKFHRLLFLHLSDTRMISHDNNTNLEPFFTALENCTMLQELEVTGLGLGGSLPSSIGGVSEYLEKLQVQENQIFGSIPAEIGNLTRLTLLNLSSNLINGIIPAEIGKLSNLEQLSLSFNFFTGIPSALGQLSFLGLMDLSHNNLSGQIPEELGNLESMTFLFLNNNLLSGKLPPRLGRCTALQKLDLSHNRLTGRVPPEISGLHEMRMFLNFSHNQLEGPLPIELSKMASIEEIDLSSNNFNGSIFSQISGCFELRVINFSHNSLQGHLPESLGDLKSLVTFDVSGNKLSGMIPTSLSKSNTLTLLNLSFNDFSGMIPTGGVFDSITKYSFLGNRHICGFVTGIPICKHKRTYFHSPIFLIIFCIVIFISGFFSVICCVIGCQRLRTIISSSQSVKQRKQPLDLTHNFPRMSYKDLSEATGGFDDQRLVGSGSFGHVYRGVLKNGTQIAVKVLHLQTGNSTKSFNRECQVLKRIRHRNLIRIITACSLPDFKALVLPYMANGSLESHLYPHTTNGLRTGSSDLSLLQRVNICSDIAEGMAYLHHHSPVKVIHCDLKPSNVLLNDDMTALVTDFGIARLVTTVESGNGGVIENEGNSTANKLCGSIGYIAPGTKMILSAFRNNLSPSNANLDLYSSLQPRKFLYFNLHIYIAYRSVSYSDFYLQEYGFGSSTSTKGDVYSFGILVLEMVTRKRPTDDMFVGELNLHNYVKNHYHRQMENAVDPILIRALRDQSPEVKKMWEVAVGELMELGILCTQESPSIRPTMLDCADDLDRLKRYLNGDTTATFASSLGISSSTFSNID